MLNYVGKHRREKSRIRQVSSEMQVTLAPHSPMQDSGSMRRFPQVFSMFISYVCMYVGLVG